MKSLRFKMLATALLLNIVIDLSHWQASVDFTKVKNAGVEGIIHKATQGTTYTDPNYASRRAPATNAGLLWGAYHFGTGTDGSAQADYFLKVVGNTDNVLLALDLEDNPSGTTITVAQAEAFVKTIKQKTGRCPVIYGNANFLKNFATPTITACPLWIARYGSEPTVPAGWSTYKIWQYTDGTNGPTPHTVDGVGACDRDQFNGSLEEFRQFWGS